MKTIDDHISNVECLLSKTTSKLTIIYIKINSKSLVQIALFNLILSRKQELFFIDQKLVKEI